MIWLILSILLLLIILLLHLRVRLAIRYEDDLSVSLKILCFNIPLFPKVQKKLKHKDYSVKKLRKRQKKLENKKAKKEKKSAEKQQKPKKELKKTITEALELIKIVLEYVMPPFGKYFKLEILKLKIKVGTSDPAKTAVTYGVVSQSVAYIIELLSNITNVDVKKQNSIQVSADFLSEKTDADINIILNLKVWHSISLAFKFCMGFLKTRSKKTTKQN